MDFEDQNEGQDFGIYLSGYVGMHTTITTPEC